MTSRSDPGGPNPGPRGGLRALLLLTASLIRRLSREGLVVRSLAFPPALVVGTLMLTIGTVALMQTDPVVAIAPALVQAGLDQALIAEGFIPVAEADPSAAVHAGDAWAGTDGHTLWLTQVGPGSLALESVVRAHTGASWRPDADVPRPNLDFAQAMGRRIVVLLGALFALYGVVFGAGMVARDRDSGILEVELALSCPRWVHGAARLLAATLGLSAFLGLGVILVDAVIGVGDPAALLRHSIACSAGSTAIGLIVIGRGGLKTGFTGPLATGMTFATALFGLGMAVPMLGAWVPLASFTTAAGGWEALAGGGVLSAIAVTVFTWRSTRT